MDITRVDSAAVLGHSALHRCSATSKLTAFGLVLAAIVASTNLLVVVAIASVLVGTAAALRLPMRLLLGLAAYPALFAALFALAAAADPLTGALVIAKAVAAALVAVMLMLTTPYPAVFAPLQRVLPRVVGDALLMTYRSLFLLFDKFAQVLTAVRIRAGLSGRRPLAAAGAATRAMGSVLLYSIDLSQRTYDVMHLRGYEGRLITGPGARSGDARTRDAVLLVGSGCVALVAAAWRLAGASAAPWSWIPLLAGAVVLLGGTLYGTLRK